MYRVFGASGFLLKENYIVLTLPKYYFLNAKHCIEAKTLFIMFAQVDFTNSVCQLKMIGSR
jgi:hypothetical protein